MMVRPFGQIFSRSVLMMLYPATCKALYSILTRKLVRFVSANVMQFHLGLTGTLSLAPFAVTLWTPPATAFDGLALGLIGGIAWAGHEIPIRANRYAAASVLTPNSYSHLLNKSVAGFLVFFEVPDILTILGSLIIVAAGLLIWRRERQVSAHPT
jgi:drug/metabolite transporter (DMT)-like permease